MPRMNRSARVLAISGAFALATALSPAMAQSESAVKQGDMAKSGEADSNVAPVSTAVSDSDVRKALSEIKSSWRDYTQCERAKLCSVYFESFGVGLTFNDGSIAPFAHAQRLTASGHDCIVNGRAALEHGDRGLAVQWVMASELQDPPLRNWLGDHPDAVIEALRRCCG
jgi:hypothetical protein